MTLRAITLPSDETTRVSRSQRWAFNGLLIFYWLLFAFGNTNAAARGNLLYYALLVPIVLYSVLSLRWVFRSHYMLAALILGVYLGLVGILASARVDFDAFSTALVFVLPLMVVINSRVRASSRVLIWLFWISVLWSMVSYYVGLNPYGFLPGQTARNLHQGLWWRVSLFPYHPGMHSGLFALVILYGILCLRWPTRFRWGSISVAAYFLVLSGSRTALLAAVLVIGLSFFVRRLGRRWRSVLPVLFLVALIVSIVVVEYPSLLTRIAPESSFLRSFLYRSTSVPTAESLAGQFSRSGMWFQYRSILEGNLLVGVGSFNITDYFPGSHNWSESRAGYLIARDGLISFVFFLVIFMILRKGIIHVSLGKVFYGVVVSVSLVYYSSYLNTYNFLYLAVMGLLNWQGKRVLNQKEGQECET